MSMQIWKRKPLFRFSMIYNGAVSEYQVERRYEPDELYHVVLFNGNEYPLRLKDDTFRFTSDYMNNMLRSYEDYITNKIFAVDM